MTAAPLGDDPIAEIRYAIERGLHTPDLAADMARKLLVALDGTAEALDLVRRRAEEAEARVAELEELLEARARGHLAELERVQERANREAAVHRHEAQAAVQQAGEARKALAEVEALVAQLRQEAAAQTKQTARLAADAHHADVLAAGYRLVAQGWQTIAEARS